MIGMELYPPEDGMKILDVGCGTGTTLNLYQKAGCNIFGIDSSSAMFSIDRNKLNSQAELLLGNAVKMEYPNETIDLIIGMLTLHEMPQNVRSNVLGEMIRVLKREGRIMIIDFHSGSIQFPKGWMYKVVIYFFEFMAGLKHFRKFRKFMTINGIPGLIEVQRLKMEKAKIVGGSNLGIYVLRVS